MSWTVDTITFKAYTGTDPQDGFVTGYADTSADLPTVAAIQSGANVNPLAGSAFVTCDDGKTYLLDSAGVWHVKAGEIYSNIYTSAEVDAMFAALDAPSVGGTGAYIQRISETDGVITATVGTLDTAPASGSDNPITSGGVYQALLEQVGIGIEFGSSAYDLDNYKTPGVWHSTDSVMTANGTHVPAPIQDPNTRRGFRLEVRATSIADYITQIVFPAWNANLPSKIYIRHYRGTSTPPQQGWSNWFEYSGTDTGS